MLYRAHLTFWLVFFKKKCLCLLTVTPKDPPDARYSVLGQATFLITCRQSQLLNALFTFLLSVQLLSLWRELQDALIGWRWTCQLLPQSCAAQTCISGIFVVNPLKLGVGGDLPKIKNLNQKMCSKGPKTPFFLWLLSELWRLSEPRDFKWFDKNLP